MPSVFAELKRRNVFRVAGVYAVVGWLLAQVATTLEEALGLPPWFDSLIVALLLIGLPVALVFAWAFELTPEGVVRTADVPADESITPHTGRKLDIAIVVGLVLLVSMLVWQRIGPDPVGSEAGAVMPDSIAAASIAVLPFADLSPEGDQEYFSDGIAEEILNALVRVDGLQVTSRTSSFQFKSADLGIPEIASKLNVRHVVEGSVRKSGETIRVTAQLIDSVDDRHLWSDTYDSPLTTENIFKIQGEIATSIVTALSDALGVGNLEPVQITQSTRNLDAYELFLRARPMFHAREKLDVADELLERALEQDPNFAAAWEIRAALQVLKVDYGFASGAREVAEQKGLEFANRALAIEPKSATALALIGMISGDAVERLRGDTPIAESLATLSKALEIEPKNASALNWRGLRYASIGYLDVAIADFAECMKHEPFYRPCVENYYTILSASGNDEAALEAFLEALSYGSAKNQFAYLPLLARQNNELAFKIATNDYFLLEGWPHHDELWQAYRNPGEDHNELIESIRAYLDSRDGGYQEAFAYLAHPLGTGWRIPDRLVMWDPMLRNYRQTAAFKNYIRETGTLEYWRQAGFPAQCRPLGNDDFNCD